MSGVVRTHRGAEAAAGPLVFLRGAPGVAFGELVELEGPGGRSWRGQVLEAAEEITVVQVLDDTGGLSPATCTARLSGELASAVVGEELLGRALDGSGEPLDGLPPPIGVDLRPCWGAPINAARRAPPADFIETGLSAIDGLNTLVRGQKLPVFAGPGLPGLELAARIVEGARAPRGEPFAVVFAAMGTTARETDEFLQRFSGGPARERSVLYLNRASDPAVERLMVPRLALTQAEHLAFDLGLHVLVVLADVLHYCEALREVGTAREETPGRRGYPGYTYTDLASLFERAGILRGGEGSLTLLPIVTMPDDDLTHPVPDLTGYVTEGQLVLGRDLHRKGVFPPIDVLPSLSRLMGAGIGEGRTIAEHRQWADQLYACYARGREARLMASIVGEEGLGPPERRALAFAGRFESELLDQGDERRPLSRTLEIGWSLMRELPREDLGRLKDAAWERFVSTEPRP